MHSTVNSMLIYNTFSIAPEYRQSQYEMCLQTTLCKAQFCFSFIFSKITHCYITANMLCSIYFFSQIKLYIWLHGGKRKGHFYILYILRKVKCRPLYCVNKKGFSILIYHRCSIHILNFIDWCFWVKRNVHKLSSAFFLYWYFSNSYELLLKTSNLDIVVLNKYIHNNPMLQYKLQQG